MHGNAEEPTSRQFQVDTTDDSVAPTVTVDATPAVDPDGVFRARPRVDLSADETATIYFQWDSTDGLGDDPAEPLRAPGGQVPGQPAQYVGGDG